MARSLVAGLSLALLLTGCVSARDAVTAADLVATPPGAVTSASEADHAPAVSAGSPFNVLVMSAGGADGAFGVGVLGGWTASGARPSFDVVTGVSTGALAATDAFLGSSHDDRLKQAYVSPRATTLLRPRGPLAFILNDGLYDTSGLRGLVAQLIDEQTVDAVAREERRGRRLFVASTNLDSGQLVVWDLGAIAASSRPDRLQAYRDAVLASASIPASFSPTYVRATAGGGSQMHVEGAVRAPVLLRSFMLPPTARDAQVWVIVNTHLARTDPAPVKPRASAIASRASLELYRSLTGLAVYQAYVLAARSGAAFNMLTLPRDSLIDEESLSFKAGEIEQVYLEGFGLGGSGRWTHEPPDLDARLRLRDEPAPAALSGQRSSDATR